MGFGNTIFVHASLSLSISLAAAFEHLLYHFFFSLFVDSSLAAHLHSTAHVHHIRFQRMALPLAVFALFFLSLSLYHSIWFDVYALCLGDQLIYWKHSVKKWDECANGLNSAWNIRERENDLHRHTNGQKKNTNTIGNHWVSAISWNFIREPTEDLNSKHS